MTANGTDGSGTYSLPHFTSFYAHGARFWSGTTYWNLTTNNQRWDIYAHSSGAGLMAAVDAVDASSGYTTTWYSAGPAVW